MVCGAAGAIAQQPPTNARGGWLDINAGGRRDQAPRGRHRRPVERQHQRGVRGIVKQEFVAVTDDATVLDVTPSTVHTMASWAAGSRPN